MASPAAEAATTNKTAEYEPVSSRNSAIITGPTADANTVPSCSPLNVAQPAPAKQVPPSCKEDYRDYPSTQPNRDRIKSGTAKAVHQR